MILTCVGYGALFKPLEIPEDDENDIVITELVLMVKENNQLNGQAPQINLNGKTPTPPTNTGTSEGNTLTKNGPQSIHGAYEQGNMWIITSSTVTDKARLALSQPQLLQAPEPSRKQTFGSGLVYRRDVLYGSILANLQHNNNAQWKDDESSYFYDDEEARGYVSSANASTESGPKLVSANVASTVEPTTVTTNEPPEPPPTTEQSISKLECTESLTSFLVPDTIGIVCVLGIVLLIALLVIAWTAWERGLCNSLMRTRQNRKNPKRVSKLRPTFVVAHSSRQQLSDSFTESDPLINECDEDITENSKQIYKQSKKSRRK